MDSILNLRRALSTTAPIVALIGAILLMVTPLRLFQGWIPTPILPLVVVFIYAVYEPKALSSPVAFLLGLTHDLLYGGGFGVWASAYLLMQYLVYTQRAYLRGRLPRVIWLAFAIAMVMVGGLLWFEQSLLMRTVLPVWPLLYQIVITIAVYPLLSLLFFALRARAQVHLGLSA